VAASEDERIEATAVAGQSLRNAGAHEVIDSVADLKLALSRIEARILRGDKP
jgi:hypothetical protein